MVRARFIACALLVVSALALAVAANQPPELNRRLMKPYVAAGKVFRYVIPSDTFTDAEDGSNLSYNMYDEEEKALPSNSWIKFTTTTREVIGLPLEDHVGRWRFTIVAQDTEGLVARDMLNVVVAQRRHRNLNHKFIMQLTIASNYKNSIDWQILAVERLRNLYNTDELTVLNATQNGNECEIMWISDSVSAGTWCPAGDIDRLMKVIESESEKGKPSAALVRAMSPELTVRSVSWRAVGVCEESPSTTKAFIDFPPIVRNQFDNLTATASRLFVFKVPEDTFFDPEDAGSSHLHLKLQDSDYSELPTGYWLQFDSEKRELYGLPTPGDEGRHDYHLIAKDSSGNAAINSFYVEVLKAQPITTTFEFQMILDYPFSMLAYDANNKRKVVEKLALLFGQKETDNIRIQSITNNPTTVVWYNTSLPTDKCPRNEIEELHKMIIDNHPGSITGPSGGELSTNVDRIFDKDLKVMSIRFIPVGLCADQNDEVLKRITKVYLRTSNS